MELKKQIDHLDHKRTNENTEIVNLKEIHRRKWIRLQLELNNSSIPRTMYESLERIYFSLIQHSNLKSIDFIDTDYLIKYIMQNAKKEFKDVTLKQTIKDIK